MEINRSRPAGRPWTTGPWSMVPAKGSSPLRPGATLTAEELIAFSRETLPGFKAPDEIEFGDLPKTTRKVTKYELRERGRRA